MFSVIGNHLPWESSVISQSEMPPPFVKEAFYAVSRSYTQSTDNTRKLCVKSHCIYERFTLP